MSSMLPGFPYVLHGSDGSAALGLVEKSRTIHGLSGSSSFCFDFYGITALNVHKFGTR